MLGATGCPANAVPLPINNGAAFNDGIDAMVVQTI
jgi:hypothetical protein